MIVEGARKLKEIATEVSVLRRSQQHGQSLVNRAQLVASLLSRAEVAAAVARTLSERLGEPWVPAAATDTAVGALEQWAAALDEDLGAALGGDLFAKFQDAVDRALRELERRAAGAWQRYTVQVTPETSQEILAALASDPSARTTVIAIRRLAESVRRLRDRQVPTPDELAEFDTAVADLRAAWSTLDVASLNDEVVAFLRAANSDRGAALALLTEPVRTWLAERHLESHYAIRPSD